MKEELLKQIDEKKDELIRKLQSMVDSQQDYDRDYHEIWVELSTLLREQSEQEKDVTDEDIEAWAKIRITKNPMPDKLKVDISDLKKIMISSVKAMRDGKIKPNK